MPWPASALLLSSTACFGGADDPQYALLQPQPGRLGVGAVQQLQTTREPGAAPPTVYARLALSEYAVERLEMLVARVTVSSAEPLEGEGLSASWIGHSGEPPIVGIFKDELFTSWSADLPYAACSQPPCVLSFELTPAGDWNRALTFDSQSMDYELRAWLEVRGQYRAEFQQLESALTISLEEAP